MKNDDVDPPIKKIRHRFLFAGFGFLFSGLLTPNKNHLDILEEVLDWYI